MACAIDFDYGVANLDCVTTTGTRIREARKALGLRQEDLAAAVGIDQSTLSDIERDRYGFSAVALFKFADALNVSADYIMTVATPPPSLGGK